MAYRSIADAGLVALISAMPSSSSAADGGASAAAIVAGVGVGRPAGSVRCWCSRDGELVRLSRASIRSRSSSIC